MLASIPPPQQSGWVVLPGMKECAPKLLNPPLLLTNFLMEPPLEYVEMALRGGV